MPPPSYYGNVNPDLLRWIPVTARTVLEVGCGSGALGARFLSRVPGARWFGVELDAASAAEATKVLSGIWNSAADDFDFGQLPSPPDTLVYGDVLEHLADPLTHLRRAVAAAAADATVVACMPNATHGAMLQALLKGTFPQADAGLFDRTHLRWFALPDMLDLFRRAGVEPIKVRARKFPLPDAAAFAAALAPALERLAVDPAEFRQRCDTLQYVIQGCRQAPQRVFLNYGTLRPQAGMVDVRIDLPAACLDSLPPVSTRISNGAIELSVETGDSARILVWQRPILRLDGTPGVGDLEKLWAKDWLLVVDFDDHPDRWPDIVRSRYLTFAAAHAVQTSTPRLAELLRRWNPEVAVFENALAELPPLRERAPTLQPTLFFGALNRADDWRPWLGAIDAAVAQLAQDGIHARFVVLHDREFFDAISCPDKRFVPTCGYAQYLELLAESDLCLAPLGATDFNACKSDLKFIEAAAHGALFLGGSTVYADTVRHGETGLICAAAEAVPTTLAGVCRGLAGRADATANLPLDFDSLQAIRRRAWEYVREQRLLAHQAERRLAWYRRLWENRAALAAAARARVDALRREGPDG